MLPSGVTSESVPSTGFSLTTMTRSGAPFQGASGEGRNVNSGASAQAEDAASAGDCAVTSSAKDPTALNNKAVAAKRRGSSMMTSLENAPKKGRLSAGRIARYLISPKFDGDFAASQRFSRVHRDVVPVLAP